MKPGPRKFELTADILLRAYSIGVFPMAESREAAEIFWVEPQERGVFPLDGLAVSRSLAKTVRITAEKLDPHRAFHVRELDIASGAGIPVHDAVRGDKFGGQDIGSLFAADSTEDGVGNPRHRGQEERGNLFLRKCDP